MPESGINLTVNDLLLLYRTLHAAKYMSTIELHGELEAFQKRHAPSQTQPVIDSIEATWKRFREANLDEVIKGKEVFSNTGRVAPGTSITRFLSARDDGQTKELVWGIVTDDEDRMHITLRDFRPFVQMLLDLGEALLADRLAQDYLDSYVQGFNRFVVELSTLVALEEPACGQG